MAEELHLAPAVRAKAVNVVDDRAAPRAARRKCEVERPARGSAERGHRFLSLGIGQRTSAGMAELFEMALRGKRRDRAARSGPELFLLERAFDDCLERIQSLGRRFDRALLIGCPDRSWPQRLAQLCERIDVRDAGQIYATQAGGEIIVEDAWLPPEAEYDLVLAIGTFDTVNQLPLALRLVRHSMRGQSLFIGALSGGETLPQLRAAMRAADAVTGAAAPHVHPRIEPSALAPLLGDAGFVRPVVDVDRVAVSYASLDRLVSDLRSMAATNLLLGRPRFVGKAARAAARSAFSRAAEGERTVETFEILHFAAWTAAEG